MNVRLYQPSDKSAWDSYVFKHPTSTHCSLSGWKDVLETTYGHKGYYLLAEDNFRIVGILPLFHIKSLIFGNQLVSMPFLNYGGVLADSSDVERSLIEEMFHLGLRLKTSHIELRQLHAMDIFQSWHSYNYREKTHKVRLILDLPDSSEELFKSFKSKLRGQIRRPQKEGMKALIGSSELLDDFYKVFSINMRDLGSPVHSKRLFKEICQQFKENVRVGVVYYKDNPVATGVIFRFRDTVEVPWASSLRRYNKLSPNMLLYWSFLEYACDQGGHLFDFGRSSPNEGTFKFKEQWGAAPHALHWHIWTNNTRLKNGDYLGESKSMFTVLAVFAWQRLPTFLANFWGPIIRRSISL